MRNHNIAPPPPPPTEVPTIEMRMFTDIDIDPDHIRDGGIITDIESQIPGGSLEGVSFQQHGLRHEVGPEEVQHNLEYKVSKGWRPTTHRPGTMEKDDSPLNTRGVLLRGRRDRFFSKGAVKKRTSYTKTRDIHRKEKQSYEDQEHTFYTLRGYDDDGDLASVRRLHRDQFEDLLRNGNVSGMRWDEPEAKEPKYTGDTVEVPVTATAKGGSPFDTIMREQEELGLPDWVGLTWSRNGFQNRIVEDRLLLQPHAGKGSDKKPRRQFVVERINADGELTGKFVHEPHQLAEFLKNANDSLEGEITTLKWEVPEDKLLSSEIQPGAGSRDLSLDEAYHVFCSPDIYDPAVAAKLAEDLKKENDLDVRKYAKELQHIVKDYGTETVLDLAESLRDEFIDDALRLGLSITEKQASISWVLIALAKQRYFSKHPAAAAANNVGAPNDPFANNTAGRLKRQETVDRELGASFARLSVFTKLEPKRELKLNKKGTSYKEVIVPEERFYANDGLFEVLQPFIKDQVEAIVKTAVSEKRKSFTGHEIEVIGRLLRRSVDHDTDS